MADPSPSEPAEASRSDRRYIIPLRTALVTLISISDSRRDEVVFKDIKDLISEFSEKDLFHLAKLAREPSSIGLRSGLNRASLSEG